LCWDQARVSAVPAKRALPDSPREARDRSRDPVALGRLIQLGVALPPPAVRANVPATRDDVRSNGGVAFKRKRACHQRYWQITLAEDARQAPIADATAIFEHRLGG
jgi:hypothetical protein